MRQRSRRRAARVDFSELVAPEESAAHDSGSEYEGNEDAANMDVDIELDGDLDIEMSDQLPSDSEINASSVGDVIDKEEVKFTPQPRARTKQESYRAPSQSAARIENLRDRLVLFYGESNKELMRAIELRHKWSDNLFTVSPSQLELFSPKIQNSKPFLSPLKRTSEQFESGGSVVTVDGFRLKPSEHRSSASAGILNAGRGVLALDWSPDGKFLALGLRTDTDDPLNSSTVQPELAPKCRPQEGRSLIHVYGVDGSELSPYASIEGYFGSVIDMHWSPNSLLGAVFADGSVGIFEVIGSGSFKLESSQLPSISDAKATCLCWRDHCLIVGYADGLVAEFDTTAEPSPSWVLHLHDSVVTSVTSGWPNMSSLLFSTGVDGNLKVTDTRDPRLVRKAPRLKHFAPVSAYLPMSDCFVGLEDANTAKLVPVRNPSVQLTLTSVTRHDAGISALASSPSHPLLLTGGQDGSVHITNPIRRTMVTRRKRDLQLDCTIWRLECKLQTSEFRFVELLTVDTLNTKREGLNNIAIYPSSVAITGLAWKPCNTWYAAGTASGLVRLENVDG